MWIYNLTTAMWNTRKIYEKWDKKYIKCWHCWELKEATNEFFRKEKTWVLWLRPRCKVCDNAYHVKYAKEHKEKIRTYWDKQRRSERQREWAKKHHDVVIQASRRYKDKHRNEIRQYQKWANEYVYLKAHRTTRKLIDKLWIRPNKCSLCWSSWNTYAHHPDYKKRYEIVFVCQSCHMLIHSWAKGCPTPINLMDISQARG